MQLSSDSSYMQLQDVAFADHKIARYHDSVCLSFAPNTRIFEAICEIAMDFLGNVQNCASFCNNVWIGKIRFFPGRLCIDPNDIQEIVHESFESFYLLSPQTLDGYSYKAGKSDTPLGINAVRGVIQRLAWRS